MKKLILFLFFISVYNHSVAQSPAYYKSNTVVGLKAEAFLDSVPIELESSFFDVSKIESVDVTKNAASGRIYIKTKNPSNINFLSYSRIKNEYFSGIDKPILLLINGQFIKNFMLIKIDSAYIYNVEVESGENFEELKKLYPALAIVNIKLNNLNNKIGERQISLEGMPPKYNPQ